MNTSRFTSLLVPLVLAAIVVPWAAGQAASQPAVPDLSRQPIVLLGEVHDNATQHALRLQAFAALLARGARPALLMEQFDRDRQGDIERARTKLGTQLGTQPGTGNAADLDAAQHVIDAAAAPDAGWDWNFYRPFIAAALAHGLPIIATNVSRAEARRVVAQGLAASGFDANVPADIEAAQSQAIESSHCGMVSAEQARRMSAAQVARDQAMAREVARAVAANAQRGVLLLAGNGHVRRDIGVPRWLAPELQAKALSVGLLEEGDDSAAAFDQVVVTPRQAREDPCAAMRRPVAPKVQGLNRPVKADWAFGLMARPPRHLMYSVMVKEVVTTLPR